MGRIQGLTEEDLTGDTLLKNGVALDIFSAVVAAEGATAGQRIVFRNGQDGSADPLYVHVIEAANGTFPVQFAQGKRFTDGCYVDFAGSAGKIHLSLTYK